MDAMQVSVPAQVQLSSAAPKRRMYKRRTYRRKSSGYNSKYYKYGKRELTKWPRSRYGTVHLERGAELNPNYDTVGPSWAEANQIQREYRTRYGYTGRGDYRKWGRNALGGLGAMGGAISGAFGGIAGGYPGMAAGGVAGGQAGWAAGRGLGRFMGLGDYTQSNQLIQGGGMPMSVNGSGDLSGDVYLTHREFVQNVAVTMPGAGTSGFQIQGFPINAGMVQTFPFMSQIAQNFTLFELQGCIFEYKPTSGEFGSSSSNQLGKVVMATNYDPSADLFSNSIQMENYDYANSAKPSIPQIHGVETKSTQRATDMLYVRTGPSQKDLIFTDIGLFQVATEGISFAAAGTAIVGELWVSYTVKCSRANLYGSLFGNNIKQDVFYGSNVNTVGPMFDNTNVALSAEAFAPKYAQVNVNTSASPKLTNSIGGTWTATNPTVSVYTFPPNISDGAYMVVCSGLLPTQVTNAFTITGLVNCSFITTGGFPSTNVSSALAIENQMETCVVIRVQAPGNLQASFIATSTLQFVALSKQRLVVTQCCLNCVQ